MIIEGLADSSDPDTETTLCRLTPARTGWDELEVRLTGLILFVEAATLSPQRKCE